MTLLVLLLPQGEIDPLSGYRYHLPEQGATSRLIRRLRVLDPAVEDVRIVPEAPDDETRNAVILAHLVRMSGQLRRTQDTVESPRQILSARRRRCR